MARNFLGRFMERLFPSRKAPVRPTTQAKQVRDKQYGGSTKQMARALGVTERTVQRWVKGDRTPRGEDARKLADAAAVVQTADRSRQKKEDAFAQRGDSGSGMTASVRLSGAEGGAPGRSKSPLVRRGERVVTVELSGNQAARILANPSDTEVTEAVSEALGDYFNRPSYEFEFDSSAVDFH